MELCDSDAEEFGDEAGLRDGISFGYPPHSALPYHLHCLDALQRALEELPPPQREVFIRHELDGVSFKAMSADSGTPINTLLSRKRSAILHLRGRLQSVYDDLDL